jgi:general secretion pathway protein B
MSYILDALRRADAERERGAVPSLQSQQHTIADDDAGAPTRSRWLVWAVVALSAALVAAIAWNLLAGRGATPARPVAEGSVAPPGGVLLPTSPSRPAETTAATASPAPQITANGTAAPEARAVNRAPSPRSSEDEERAKAPAAVAKAHPRAPAEAETRQVATRQRESKRAESARDDRPKERAAGETRVYKQSELPDDIRRDLPKLAIGGASYSGDAASRMVMINGQVFHEGDALGPNLVLERIKLKSAVLSYKGYRYEVTF